jgi:hypothetical protein
MEAGDVTVPVSVPFRVAFALRKSGPRAPGP